MNPRGRQYALAGTLDGWAELSSLTARQRRALRIAYRGCNPMVFSRYGRRQWAAPLPFVRVVMKDPFAMLSIPAVVAATGAAPVLLYRHPGASLASYRRMGWEPDLDELDPILTAHRLTRGTPAPAGELAAAAAGGPAEAMGRFWSGLYEIALDNAGEVADLLIVSHEELAGGGQPAAQRLFDALGLRWSAASDAEFAAESGSGTSGEGQALHNFARPPAAVAGAWRKHVDADEIEIIEAATERVRLRLQQTRLPLAP